MSKFSLDKNLIQDLAALLDQTGLTEIEWEEEDRRVRVARQPAAAAASRGAATTPAPAPAAAAAAAPPAPATAADPLSHPGAVTSPMVGTAYLSPEPEAPPFVRVGDQVTEGQTLLIVEAMKTMNPIPAPRAGTLGQVLVANGDPVEYGELLMVIE